MQATQYAGRAPVQGYTVTSSYVPQQLHAQHARVAPQAWQQQQQQPSVQRGRSPSPARGARAQASPLQQPPQVYLPQHSYTPARAQHQGLTPTHSQQQGAMMFTQRHERPPVMARVIQTTPIEAPQAQSVLMQNGYNDYTDFAPQVLDPNTGAPMMQTQPEEANHTDSEFMKLLDSLEVRVDLMAQMQHTRNQIQARAKELEEQQYLDNSGEYGFQMELQGAEVGYGQTGPDPLTLPVEALANELAQVRQELMSASGRVSSSPDVHQWTTGPDHGEAARKDLARENEELWHQLGDQREIITKLSAEVESLRRLLGAFGVSDGGSLEELQGQMRSMLTKARESAEEVQLLRSQLKQEQRQRQAAERDWADERERLLAEIEKLRLRSAGEPPDERPYSNTAALRTEPVLPLVDVPSSRGGGRTISEPSVPQKISVKPFSRNTCGVNVALSEDGYTATRTRGCRQSVLIGSEPLEKHPLGWYFEVEIRETVEGWVGGLGIGVTRTGPKDLRRVPDKAWRMPSTYIVGYWGCVFLDGKELRTQWRADTLPSGARVGVLISGDGSGDLRVFVEGESVVCIDGAMRGNCAHDMDVYPVVDVFAATLAVALKPECTVPPPPWRTDNHATISPPGSPGGMSMVSATRSMANSSQGP